MFEETLLTGACRRRGPSRSSPAGRRRPRSSTGRVSSSRSASASVRRSAASPSSPVHASYLRQLAAPAVRRSPGPRARDGPLCERAVRELDRVLRSPSTIGSRASAGPPRRVLQQSVPVRVAEAGASTSERPPRRRGYQAAEDRRLHAPPQRRPVNDQEERGRIDAAEVGARAARRAAASHSRRVRRTSCRIFPGCSSLSGSSAVSPDAPRGPRGSPPCAPGSSSLLLVARDEAVAAKEGDEPGDARRQDSARRVERPVMLSAV